MKTQIRKATNALMLGMIFSLGLMAQPGQGRYYNQDGQCRLTQVIPDLTDEQVASLMDLRAEQIESAKEYRNQMGEIRAKQRTLWSQTPVDQKAAEKLIDEKSALSSKHQKQSLAHRAAISEILTDEQQAAMKQMKYRNQNFYRKGGNMNGNWKQGRRGQCQGRNFAQGRRGGNQGKAYYGNGGRGQGFGQGQGRW